MKYTTSMKDSQINFYFEGSGAGSHIYYCPPNWPAHQNLYYWSIPKNASTLIRKLFKLNPKNFDSTLSFTILREPWSRLKSAFVMGIGEKYKCQYTMQQISDWLIKDTNGCNADLMVHFIQQSKYLEYRPYKHVPIDHWFIMEDMPSLACFLGKIWNRPWKEFEVVGDSYYPEHFDEIYDTWLDNNKNWAFDMVILENAYKQEGLPVPWQFWRVRDARTIYSLYPDLPKPKASHHALEDCKRQIDLLQQTLAHLGVKELR